MKSRKITLYKITDHNYCSYGGCKWGKNIEHSAPGRGKLCTDAYLHAYCHPLLAAFFNPIYGRYTFPVLWKIQGIVKKADGTKVGCTWQKTLKIIPLPEITTEQQVKIAILCVKEVFDDLKWNDWADKWLSGKDRSVYSAKRALHAKPGDELVGAATAWKAFMASEGIRRNKKEKMKYLAAQAVDCAVVWLTRTIVGSMETKARAIRVTKQASACAVEITTIIKNIDIIKIIKGVVEVK